MQIVVIGGGGVLGQALIQAICLRGVLTRSDGTAAPVKRVISVDRAQPLRLFLEPRVEYVRADFDNPRLLQAVMGTHTDSVFHAWDAVDHGPSAAGGAIALASSLRDLMQACELQTQRVKVVLASTFGAQGCPMAPGDDARHRLPAARHGLACLVGELLLAEATSEGAIDGRSLRLPWVVGAPGCARFVGEMLRALKQGRTEAIGIAPDRPLWLTSPAVAARGLLHVHELPTAAYDQAGILNAPASKLTIVDLTDAAGRVSSLPLEPPAVVPDAALAEEMDRYPQRVPIEIALTLGFEHGPDAEALVRDLLAQAPDEPPAP